MADGSHDEVSVLVIGFDLNGLDVEFSIVFNFFVSDFSRCAVIVVPGDFTTLLDRDINRDDFLGILTGFVLEDSELVVVIAFRLSLDELSDLFGSVVADSCGGSVLMVILNIGSFFQGNFMNGSLFGFVSGSILFMTVLIVEDALRGSCCPLIIHSAFVVANLGGGAVLMSLLHISSFLKDNIMGNRFKAVSATSDFEKSILIVVRAGLGETFIVAIAMLGCFADTTGGTVVMMVFDDPSILDRNFLVFELLCAVLILIKYLAVLVVFSAEGMSDDHSIILCGEVVADNGGLTVGVFGLHISSFLKDNWPSGLNVDIVDSSNDFSIRSEVSAFSASLSSRLD